MRRAAGMELVGLAVLAVVVAAGCGSGASAELPEAADYAHDLFLGANAERVAEGLEPLEWNECLVDQALERADAVKGKDILEHEPLSVQCTDSDLSGENLARVEAGPTVVVEQWMNSPSHAANILTAAFQYGGVGCVPAEAALACSWLAEGTAGEGSVIS